MRILFIISFTVLIGILSCNKNEDETLYSTGIVIASGGLYDCPYQIILDDDSHLYPVNNEVLIPFKSGQQISFSYKLVNDSTCSIATSIEIIELESMDCLAYADLYFYNYDSLKNDPITLINANIENDCFILELSYSGCTTDHPIDLSRSHPSCGTPPLPPPTFFINHDSRDEKCKMLVTKSLSFDLTPLKDEGNDVEFNVYYSATDTEVKSLNFTYSY